MPVEPGSLGIDEEHIRRIAHRWHLLTPEEHETLRWIEAFAVPGRHFVFITRARERVETEAMSVGLDEVWDAVEALSDEMFTFSEKYLPGPYSFYVAWNAITALIVRGLISPEDYDALTLPWRCAVGPVHPDDDDSELERDAHVEWVARFLQNEGVEREQAVLEAYLFVAARREQAAGEGWHL